MAAKKWLPLILKSNHLKAAEFHRVNMLKEESITSLDKKIIDDNFTFIRSSYIDEVSTLKNADYMDFRKHLHFVERNGLVKWLETFERKEGERKTKRT